MICRDLNCIFIHIPKTGGQSIEHFLLRAMGLTWEDRSPFLLRYNPDPRLGPERLTHLTATEYVRHGYLSRAEFAACFKFAIVRNPWDRLVSEYLYRRHQTRYGFREFVSQALPQRDPYSDAYRHVMPQYEYLFDSEGKQLVDFVGRFESLQQDFDRVCEQLGIEKGKLPRINTQSARNKMGRRARLKRLLTLPLRAMARRLRGPSYRVYYDKQTTEIVRRIYRKDIETFMYAFGS